jgi:response regulator RpfG family c-di-GMP phosphodiesterase
MAATPSHHTQGRACCGRPRNAMTVATTSPAVPAEPAVTGAAPPETAATAPARILCVDDEPDVLASLRRLFLDSGFSVRIADSAATGLQILENEEVDLVFSDLHMPQMDGARFLAVVRERWPQTVRMLMTGHADAGLIAEAVNSGEIHRYIAKPWNDEDIVAQARMALERRSIEREKARLEQIARTRTEELKALNASLEQNVSASRDELALANKRLKSNFITSLKVFASLIETRRKFMIGHARRVADLAHRLATRLKLEPALVHEVFVAGLLHDVGKLAFTDGLLDTPVANMTRTQLQQYRQHPARAEELLMPLQDLRGVAAVIGAQMERYDGTGFPRQLQGRAILVGARILAVCSDYDNLQIGILAPRMLLAREAITVIERSSGKRYDPWVVDAFVGMVRGKPEAAAVADAPVPATGVKEPDDDAMDDMMVQASDLATGMVLSRDLMLPAGHVIDTRLIDKMQQFEKTDNCELTIYVKKPQPGDDA